MNKMNKKGFTLIEMLVVIAIIAVLVSIIIPVVGNSTTKAQCATNAANLRSVKAEIMTQLLTGMIDTTAVKKDLAADVTFKDLDKAPALKEGVKASAEFAPGADFDVTVNAETKEVTVTYDGWNINDWANAAS